MYSLSLLSILLSTGLFAASVMAADTVVVIPLMSKATGTAVPGDVLDGKTFSADAGVNIPGTMPDNGAVNITPTTSPQAITAGYHNGSGSVAGDAALISANIKSGSTIFGVAGNPNVVNTASGDAASGDMLSGKTAYVAGAPVTGNILTRTLSPDNDTVNGGYYTATSLSAVDGDLATANIKSGITIFGVAGDPNVVNTASGDAVSVNIVTGKVAWVDGAEVTGIGAALSHPAPVARTAQTPTVPIAAPTGSDGDLQKGTAWPNPRFSNNSDDGTVTDNLTGLTWLANASCTDTVGGVDKSGNILAWADALTWSNNLADGDCGLTDSSSAGDWRLPNVQELQSLIAYQYYSRALSNDAGTAKWANDATSTFSGVVPDFYWSSSSYASYTDYAWSVGLNGGYVNGHDKANSLYVWPVRD